MDRQRTSDDIRTEIVANKAEYEECCKKVNVYPTFYLPKGFRSMNPYELQRLLTTSKDLVENYVRLLDAALSNGEAAFPRGIGGPKATAATVRA